MTVGVVFISWKTCKIYEKVVKSPELMRRFTFSKATQSAILESLVDQLWPPGLMFDTPVPREQKSKSESSKFTEIETFQAVLQQ